MLSIDSQGLRECFICGEPIAPRRLVALPNVQTCIRCADEQPVFAAPNPHDESGTDFVILPGRFRERTRTYLTGAIGHGGW